jgi:hypothetical protein
MLNKPKTGEQSSLFAQSISEKKEKVSVNV